MIRPATIDDDEAIANIGRAFGFDDPDSAIDQRYLAFVRAHGRLIVAEQETEVVGYGAMIDVDGVCMIADLFLSEQVQNRGIGQQMVSALIDGYPNRMTASSKHPAALPTYLRNGMVPQGSLHYLRGVTGPADSSAEDAVTCSWTEAPQWLGDRADLVRYWTDRDLALAHFWTDGQLIGWAIVVHDEHWLIQRLVCHTSQPGECLRSLLAALPAGEAVLLCVPETQQSTLVMLDTLRFERIDRDILCSSSPELIPSSLVVLHPGLA